MVAAPAVCPTVPAAPATNGEVGVSVSTPFTHPTIAMARSPATVAAPDAGLVLVPLPPGVLSAVPLREVPAQASANATCGPLAVPDQWIVIVSPTCSAVETLADPTTAY